MGGGREGGGGLESQTNMDGNLVSYFKLIFILGQLQLCIVSIRYLKEQI